jgi:hypothetical protein
MARCKNVGGSPPGGDEGDGGDSPPRLIEVARGKSKLISRKKRTREDREADEALAVSRAVDRAESGGRGSGILIGESHTRVPLSGCVLGTKAIELTEDQSEVSSRARAANTTQTSFWMHHAFSDDTSSPSRETKMHRSSSS